MNARLLLLLTITLGLLLGSASCSSDPAPSNPTSSGTTAGLGEQCPVGHTNCNGVCADTLSNSGHCGECGTICQGGTACVNGACECQAGSFSCAGSCVNVQADNNNCGGCGVVCPAGQSCNAGECTCTAGTACGAACVDIALDPINCGGCGQICQNVQQCAAGACQCRVGWTDCGAGCSNPSSDPQNCGGCGVACVAPQVCSQGACAAACAAGLTNCSGACEDTLTSALNCGGCGVQCAAGQDCMNGACTCAGGLANCAGTCTNTMTDAANCGGCGVPCAAGQSCSAGSCGCGAGQQSCTDSATGTTSCRDVQSDSSNCGGCGMTCAGGQSCSGGVCSCPVGQELCDDACVALGSCNPTTTATSTMTSTSTTSTTGSGGATSTSTTSTTNTSTTGGGSCMFTVEDDLSDAIATVGIVTFSVTGTTVTKAEIQFTRDGGGPTYVAPVDLSVPNYRTLLLGMKGQSTYNYQIVVNDGECSSPMRSIMTGPVANSVPTISHQAQNPGSATATGFIVLSAGLGGFGAPGGGGGAPAFIIDMDGDPVWWAAAPASCSRARMDWEGKNMWMLELNVDRAGGEMRRVAMDGTDAQNNIQGLNNSHHDFTVLPGGIIATVSWNSGGGIGSEPPSDLLERSPDGTITKVATLDQNFYNAGAQGFHANSILWHEEDQSYTVGDRYPNLYIKLTRGGQLVWQFGGQNPVDQSKFISGGSWSVNHGHHLLDNGNIIIFNNGNGGQSPVIEFALNVAGGTASEVWRYTGGSSNVLGDVQRLENGNTLVTYSVSGVIQEVSQAGSAVQQFTTDSLGYATYRPSLYGPPPK